MRSAAGPLLLLVFWLLAGCAAPTAVPTRSTGPATAQTSEARIPPMAERYHRQLVREVRYYCGMACEVAMFAAQLHVESAWRSGVCSAYACGLGQFAEGTAKDLGQAYPKDFPGGFDVLDPWQALRATVMYDMDLWRENLPFGDDAWAAALVCYNGGCGNLLRERQAAARRGGDPQRWWCHVEHVCLRTRPGACAESRAYPVKVLRTWRPVYAQAGW